MVSNDCNWITIDPPSGDADTVSLKVTVSENRSDSRESSIIIAGGNVTDGIEIVIKQKGIPFNKLMADGIANAYEAFLEKDELPTSVNVDGLNWSKGQYLASACLLLQKIQDDPEHWEDEEIDVPVRMSNNTTYANNTFEQDSISLEALTWAAAKAYTYAESHGAMPNYVSFGTITCPGRGQDSTFTYTYDNPFKDGVKYIGNLIWADYGAALLRVFHYYKHNSELPEKVCTWGSDYLRKTNNCAIDDPVVIAAKDAALAKLPENATQIQKVKALFEYARDQWEWEDYSNTSKGSVRTIQAKGGNCCDLTHATLAMCRAAGIPARYMHGQCYFSSGVIGHVIPEIWDGHRWWICDPSNNSATMGNPSWKGMNKFNGRYKELPF